MAKVKLKVGDKIRIRKDLIENTYYNNIWFDNDMKKYRGKIATINIAPQKGARGWRKHYHIDIDVNRDWSENMFTKVGLTLRELVDD